MNRFFRGTLFLAAAALLCAPSLSWALGDPEFRNRSVEAMAGAVVFGPALLIFFLRKRWQWALLSLLLALLLWEQVAGVTMTSQLNHEGSDLAFAFIRFIALFVFLPGLELGLSRRGAQA